MSKVDSSKKSRFFGDDTVKHLEDQKKHFHVKVDNLKVKMQCEYCGGPINGKSQKCLNLQTFKGSFAASDARTTMGKSICWQDRIRSRAV